MRNHVAWRKQSAELRNAPSETKRSDKNMGAPDRIASDPAISLHPASATTQCPSGNTDAYSQKRRRRITEKEKAPLQ
jgi:hypothetical protein